jgi:hypothetical protein
MLRDGGTTGRPCPRLPTERTKPQEATIMTQQTEQVPTQPVTIPARIALADLVEAVSRGVALALAAQDDVGGYSLDLLQTPVVLTTVIYCPPPPPSGPLASRGSIVGNRS